MTMDFIPNPLLMPDRRSRRRPDPFVFAPIQHNPIGLMARPTRPVNDVDEELAGMRWMDMNPFRNAEHRRLLVENVLKRRQGRKENKKPMSDSRMRSLVASAGRGGGPWSELTRPLR